MATFAEVGKDLYSLGLVSSHGGNLSVRNGHEMWITGTGTMLGRLRDRHMSLVLPDGTHTGPPPSSDTLLHSTIYALGGAQAVVHAHPHHAIAMTFDTGLFVPARFRRPALLGGRSGDLTGAEPGGAARDGPAVTARGGTAGARRIRSWSDLVGGVALDYCPRRERPHCVVAPVGQLVSARQ